MPASAVSPQAQARGYYETGSNMEKDTEKNYNLKSEAVETLVNADTEAVPEYSEEELAKYRTPHKFRIPETVKVLFLKAWFAGAVCYFILWGLGMYIYSLIDMLFVLGVVLGMVTDLLTNNVIRFIEKNPGANDRWLMFPKKGMASFFWNILYAMVLLICVYALYTGINYTYSSLTGNMDVVLLGVEPLLFGIFCMGFDVLFLFFKRMIGSIFADAKNKARN